MTFTANETNRYAEKVLNETIIRRTSRYKDWKPTDAVEMKIYWFAFAYGNC